MGFSARLLLPALAAISIPAHSQSASLGSLSWLAGCWAPEAGKPGSLEHRLPPAGGIMLGVSRTVNGGRTVEYEFTGIQAEPDRRIICTARPDGGLAARIEGVRGGKLRHVDFAMRRVACDAGLQPPAPK